MNALSKSSETGTGTSPVEPKPARKSRKRILVFSVPLAILLAGGIYLLTGERHETTDNAYLHLARATVASDLPGRVVAVGFADDQTVRKGDPLFRIDPEPCRLALGQAEAALSNARLAMAQKNVAANDAAFLATEAKRQITLAGRCVVTAANRDEADHAAARAAEVLASADQGVMSAQAALGGAPRIASATIRPGSRPRLRATRQPMILALPRCRRRRTERSIRRARSNRVSMSAPGPGFSLWSRMPTSGSTPISSKRS